MVLIFIANLALAFRESAFNGTLETFFFNGLNAFFIMKGADDEKH